MQNVLAVNFKVRSEGYQAITALSRKPVSEKMAILEMALVENKDGKMEICDTYQSGLHTTDDTIRGGLIGSMLGILGGPIGFFLGGSAGALTGSMIDAGDAMNMTSMMERVATKMASEDTSLIILAEESEESELDEALKDYQAEILRFDAAVIAAEVEEAQKMQKEMERQAKLQLRATKKEEYKKSVEEKRSKLAADFEAFKAKFKK